jgi:hypothetical protein
MATRSDLEPILTAEEIRQLDLMLAAHHAQLRAECIRVLRREEKARATRLQAGLLSRHSQCRSGSDAAPPAGPCTNPTARPAKARPGL